MPGASVVSSSVGGQQPIGADTRPPIRHQQQQVERRPVAVHG
jgi:hypothetical protein